MARPSFHTPSGRDVTVVTADEMREVDRVAVEEVGLELLQMMENAGRILAWHVRAICEPEETVVVVAGNGGNGGGGMAGARHLANREIPVSVLLDRSPDELTGAAAHQHRVLEKMGVPILTDSDGHPPSEKSVVIDALIGYGLREDVRPPATRFIERINDQSGTVVSLDVPSGIDATSGETRGVSVTPTRTITLALPKTGLGAVPGTLFVADIAIPGTVYERIGIEYENPFGDRDWVELER